MTKLKLSIATEAYDRVQALRDGRVRIEGCDHEVLVMAHEPMFLRAFHNREFDISELSMSSYLVSVASGNNAYSAIPVFPSRLFRHSAIYINTRSGVARPSDLVGKRIGVPEYQMTAALWARGLLDDEYGVPPRAMRWFHGGLHETGREEKLALDLPAEISMTAIGPAATLDSMLRHGEIDALITARAPHGFTERDERVARLFPDYRTIEQAYFKKTGIFPIMHVMAIRRELVVAHPWLANAVCDAFAQSKQLAIAAFSDVSALRVTLPWFAAELEATRAIMGEDFWPDGIAANLGTLSIMLDYAYRHGTIRRPLTLSDVFVPSTLVQARV